MPSGVPRIPEPWEWLQTKVCTRCGEPKPWAKFSPRTYWPNGSVRTVLSYCQACYVKRSLTYRREWTDRNRERDRVYKREWGRRRRAALRRERSTHVDLLPLEPFVSWLNEKIDDLGITEVAEIVGTSPRSLRRVIDRESQRVSLSLVDKCMVAFGERVDDLYPYEEVA